MPIVRKKVKDLKPGDMVFVMDRTTVEVVSIVHNPLFEGKVFDVNRDDGGYSAHAGEDVVEIEVSA